MKAEKGDTVKVHYTGKLNDGTVFDSSVDRDPLQFTLGEGRLIPEFEKAVEGMGVGESKTIKIEAKNAYGERREELVIQVDKNKFPQDQNLEVGQKVQVGVEGQGHGIATITNIKEDTVEIDVNHPLAGKDLNFEIQLVKILE